MDWRDDAIVLSARRHGEGALIVQLLTAAHGRHAGLVRGGASQRNRATYEPGNEVAATWRARLDEHLGSYTCELTRSRIGGILSDPLRLSALSAACAVVETALPERAPHPEVHADFVTLLDAFARDDWPAHFVAWELALLADLGYGLDLSECAATGRNDDLAFVSPRSGRAVSLSAGEPYRDRLLPLPAFLLGQGAPAPLEIAQGLRLTGAFLEKWLFAAADRPPPEARGRFVARYARSMKLADDAIY